VLPFALRPHDRDDVTTPLVTLRIVHEGTPARPTSAVVRVRSAMEPDYRATFETNPEGLATFAPPPVFAVDVRVRGALVGTYAFVRDARSPGSVRDVVVPAVVDQRLEVATVEKAADAKAYRERLRIEAERRRKERAERSKDRRAPDGGDLAALAWTVRLALTEVAPLDDLAAFAEAETRFGSGAGLLAIAPGSMRLPVRIAGDGDVEVAFSFGEDTRFRLTFRRPGDGETRGLDGAVFPRRTRIAWADMPIVR
jgi:hypothetical protein